MERTLKVSWIQDTDLIATTQLNGRGLQSTVEWEGQLSGKRCQLNRSMQHYLIS